MSDKSAPVSHWVLDKDLLCPRQLSLPQKIFSSQRVSRHDAQIVITVEREGKEISLTHPAAVAESAVAVNKATNSDYYFQSEIMNSAIVFKPDVNVLKTWPQWAKPPNRKDLDNCVITLDRI